MISRSHLHLLPPGILHADLKALKGPLALSFTLPGETEAQRGEAPAKIPLGSVAESGAEPCFGRTWRGDTGAEDGVGKAENQ